MRRMVTGVSIGLLAAVTIAQDDGARRQLMPTGKLRVGLNYGNQLLVGRDRAEPQGVAIDLARELARRLGTEAVFVGTPLLVKSLKASRRSGTSRLSPRIPTAARRSRSRRRTWKSMRPTWCPPRPASTWLARWTAPEPRLPPGPRSAGHLFLKRALTRAQLVLMANDAALAALQGGTVDAIAGLRFALLQSASRVPGSRVLPITSRVPSRPSPCPKQMLRRWHIFRRSWRT